MFCAVYGSVIPQYFIELGKGTRISINNLCSFTAFLNYLIELHVDVYGGFLMGTIIGFVVLAAIDWFLVRKTGLHIHQWISRKYEEYLQGKENNK